MPVHGSVLLGCISVLVLFVSRFLHLVVAHFSVSLFLFCAGCWLQTCCMAIFLVVCVCVCVCVCVRLAFAAVDG